MSQIQQVKPVNYLEWHEEIFGIVQNTLEKLFTKNGKAKTGIYL